MKHYLSYIISIVLLLSGVNGAAGQDNSTTPTYWENMASGVSKIENKDGGDGSAWDDAILIATAQELAYFAQQVNSRGDIAFGENSSIKHNGAGGTNFKDYYFALSADIDLSGHYWTPIGSASPSFKGHFDGAGHEVKGLVVNMEGQYGSVFAGLFGYLYDGAVIRNLGVRLGEEGVKVTLAYVEVDYDSAAYAGGLAGYLSNGSISNCYVEGEACVMASGPNNVCAGGLVGFTFGSATITHCYTTVNVSTEGLQRKECGAGGIVGLLNNSGNISYTYATGIVGTTASQMAGGICGRLYGGGITNSLALNTEINGEDTGRIGYSSYGTFSGNYASPEIQVNGQAPTDNLGTDKKNGANTYLDSFETDLKNADPNNGWDTNWIFGSGKLPKLRGMGGNPPDAASYFPSKHTLYIVSPTGGTLKVTDEDGTELFDGSKIPNGTLLTLSYTENANYRFSEYLSGSSAGNLHTLSAGTIQISDADLYLSARFTYYDPTPPPPTVYYTVSLPSVEGAVTDPSAGSYEVESWDTFCFYLTLDADYSESQPVVTTSRNETLQPRTSDGAYLVKYVRTDVEIFIDGIVKNLPPVANEPIRAAAPEPEIWSENSSLYVRLPEGMEGGATGGATGGASSTDVRIFTPGGSLLDSFRSVPGLNRRQLPTGIYIVQVGATVRKIIVK